MWRVPGAPDGPRCGPRAPSEPCVHAGLALSSALLTLNGRAGQTSLQAACYSILTHTLACCAVLAREMWAGQTSRPAAQPEAGLPPQVLHTPVTQAVPALAAAASGQLRRRA
jgi:hypothetical protein